MSTLPAGLANLIVAFAPLFSERVFQSVRVLVTGAILATGKRTVTAFLRVMGLSQDTHFQTYHRVLNRAAWSSLPASRILLPLLVRAFAPEAVNLRRGRHHRMTLGRQDFCARHLSRSRALQSKPLRQSKRLALAAAAPDRHRSRQHLRGITAP
jgi:hypothetical protein